MLLRILVLLCVLIIPHPANAVAIAELSFETTRLDGSLVQSIQTNQDFLFKVYTQDLRTPPIVPALYGVFAAYFDVSFDGNLATVAGAPLFGASYPFGRMGTFSSAGLMDDVGAFAGSSSGLGLGKNFLFSVPMRANSPGILNFVGSPPALSTPRGLEFLVYGIDRAIPPSNINFGAVQLNILGLSVPEPSSFFILAGLSVASLTWRNRFRHS